MSPLQTGIKSIKNNVIELMGPILSPSRQRAISTLAKKHNISFEEAKVRQALAIARSQARKP